MDQATAKQFVLNKLSVTNQKVILAKAFLISAVGQQITSTELLVDHFLTHMHAELPTDEIVLPSPGSPTTSLVQLAESFSWALTAVEALWSLIHSDLLLPASSSFAEFKWSFRTRSGSTTSFGGFSFDTLNVQFPKQVYLAPSRWMTTQQPLSDADLYLHEIDIPNLNPEIVGDLREAVNCFRHELYTACLAMLGKASEAAWSETGFALVEAIPNGSESHQLKKTLAEPNVGIGLVVAGVRKLYERQDLAAPVIVQSGIKPQALGPTLVWTDAVRDSRNVLHYGATPAMSNSYEKVAALLIGAVPNIRTLYQIKAAADVVTASIASSAASK